MATLNELRRELRRQQNLSQAQDDLKKIDRERKELMARIKREKRKRKFGTAISIGKKIGRGISGGAKAAAAVAKRIDEAEKSRIQSTKRRQISNVRRRQRQSAFDSTGVFP